MAFIQLNKADLQFIYKLIYHPFLNRIIRNSVKAFPFFPQSFKIPPSGIIEVKLPQEESMMLKTNQTCHVTNVVFWNGPDSYEYTTILQSLFPKIKVYFDVGANIGYLSTMAGKMNPDLQVFAFDPSPGPYAYLRENIELNHLNNVHAFDLALSNEDGEFSFHFAYNAKYPYLKHASLGGSGHLSHVRENPTKYTVKVKATTLDNFVEKRQIQALDLLKLDVEEAEHLVLAGGRKSIARFRPIVVCEVFSNEMLVSIRNEIISLGYFAFIFENQRLRKTNLDEFSKIERIENFFFVPEEKALLIRQFEV